MHLLQVARVSGDRPLHHVDPETGLALEPASDECVEDQGTRAISRWLPEVQELGPKRRSEEREPRCRGQSPVTGDCALVHDLHSDRVESSRGICAAVQDPAGSEPPVADGIAKAPGHDREIGVDRLLRRPRGTRADASDRCTVQPIR